MPDTPATPEVQGELELEGFAEALTGMGNPGAEVGEPEPTSAVDTSATEESPAVEADKPEGAPAETEDSADTQPTVNFDGFSDAQKATWERLYKSGAASADEVETARKESLFQSAWTKKTTALAREKEEWAKEQDAIKEDLEILKRIRSDDRLHQAFLRAARHEVEESDEGSDELIDAKKAEEIVDRRLSAREAERQAQMAREQAAYDARRDALSKAANEWMTTYGISREEMREHLSAEEALLPEGIDPIAHFTPEALHHKIVLRHEAFIAKAEAAKLRDQLSKRTSHDARAAKQSLPPARRVAQNGQSDPFRDMESDLGLDQDWSNVAGFGHRGPR